MKDLLEDYSRQEVPDEATVSGWRIGLIMVGVAITVPCFMVGAQLGMSLGSSKALLAFIVGGAILTLVTGLAGSVGARYRLSTAMIIAHAFGSGGSRVVNSVLALTWIGWFTVIAALFGNAVSEGLAALGWPGTSSALHTVWGSVLIALVTIFGFKALDKLTLLCVPIMLLFLLLINFLAPTRNAALATVSVVVAPIPLGEAISMVVGTFIVGATMFPDLCRYAHTTKDAWISAVIAFAIGFPIILAMSALPAIATGEGELLKIIAAVGLAAPGFVMLVFATWTTNAYNIYSGSLAVAALTPVAKWKLAVAITVIGTLMAVLPTAHLLLPWVTFLSITIPPISGVYISANFLMRSEDARKRSLDPNPDSSVHWKAFFGWAMGIAVAAASQYEVITLSGIPAIDGIITASITYLLAQRVMRPKHQAS